LLSEGVFLRKMLIEKSDKELKQLEQDILKGLLKRMNLIARERG